MTKTKENICLIGPSNYYKSGITDYLMSLATILQKSSKFNVHIVFLRKFVPAKLFPGKNRKIQNYPLKIPLMINYYNGIDWTLIPSLIKALMFVKESKSKTILVQWWSSSILFIYLILMYINQILNLKWSFIIECHEVFDPKEQKNPILRLYVKTLAPLLFKKSKKIIFHSKAELKEITTALRLSIDKSCIINHISPVLYKSSANTSKESRKKDRTINLLYFGLIREYRGIKYLIKAFEEIKQKKFSNNNIMLNIIGEIWENKEELDHMIKTSVVSKIIKLTNEYIPDSKIPEIFNSADLIILPYLRGTQSGVLHLAMTYDKPIIISDVGGFSESLKDYSKKFFVRPCNIDSLSNALNIMIKKIITGELEITNGVQKLSEEKNINYIIQLKKIIEEIKQDT